MFICYSSTSYFSGKSPDFKRLLCCIENLNQLAGYGEPQISLTNDGATFKVLNEFYNTLYSNGMHCVKHHFSSNTRV